MLRITGPTIGPADGHLIDQFAEQQHEAEPFGAAEAVGEFFAAVALKLLVEGIFEPALHLLAERAPVALGGAIQGGAKTGVIRVENVAAFPAYSPWGGRPRPRSFGFRPIALSNLS